MLEIKKVLIAEMDPDLGPMVKERLKNYLKLEPQNIILTSNYEEAMDKAKNAKKEEISVAIIGHITCFCSFIEEQELINFLKRKVPDVRIISCTGRAMKKTDVDIPRTVGYFEIEEVVSGLFKKRKRKTEVVKEAV